MSDIPILVDLHENIYFDEEKGEVVILDRRKLPGNVAYHRSKTYEEVAKAIENMVTQSLGVSPAAGYGVVLAAYNTKNKEPDKKRDHIHKAIERMKNTRPTQTSLHHLVDEMSDITNETIKNDGDVFNILKTTAYNWTDHILSISKDMGRYASKKVEDGDTILTHCYGGPAIYFTGHYARENGKEVDFYVSETRPYLQGARLTSYALKEGKFDVTLITDGMPAHCMQEGKIDKFITGADRISMDGGVANKIGTYQIALAADKYDIPFYAHSYDGPDRDTPTWKHVEIEERDPEEIFNIKNERIAPRGIKGYYPAFDCTPPELVEGVITENGIYKPENVQKHFK